MLQGIFGAVTIGLFPRNTLMVPVIFGVGVWYAGRSATEPDMEGADPDQEVRRG